MEFIITDKLIEGITITPLNQIHDERGAVYHVLKSNSKSYYSFGEAYFSKINPGIVKGWKLHKEMKQNFCVPYGCVKLVLIDDRETSDTYGYINEIILDSNENYIRVTIPEKIWYSFKCESIEYSLLLNIASMIYDPMESVTIDLLQNKFSYKW